MPEFIGSSMTVVTASTLTNGFNFFYILGFKVTLLYLPDTFGNNKTYMISDTTDQLKYIFDNDYQKCLQKWNTL